MKKYRLTVVIQELNNPTYYTTEELDVPKQWLKDKQGVVTILAKKYIESVYNKGKKVGSLPSEGE